MILPSKKLLSQLGYGKVTYIGDVTKLYTMDCLMFKCNVTRDSGRNDGKTITTSHSFHVALEVLEHKCKEWLHEHGYMFDIKYPTNCNPHRVTLMFYGHVTQAFHVGIDENEAVFKTCEWALNQIKTEDGVK